MKDSHPTPWIAACAVFISACAATGAPSPAPSVHANAPSVSPAPATAPASTQQVGVGVGVAVPQQQAPAMSARGAPYPYDSSVSHVTMMFGGSAFDADFWAPVDDMFSFGIVVDTFRPENIVGFEFGTNFTFDNGYAAGLDVWGSTAEFYGGVRKTLQLIDDQLNPYVGAGATFMYADVSVEQGNLGADEYDLTFGGYLHGGAYWDFGNGLTLGADYRWVYGTSVEFAGASGDADYQQITATFGFRF